MTPVLSPSHLRIRATKAVGDLWAARGHGALAALVIGLGAVCTRLQALDAVVAAGVALLTLLGVGLALTPLGRARAAEARLLCLLGATDAVAVSFAVVEAGALGGLAGLAGALLALALGPASVSSGSPAVGGDPLGLVAVWVAAAGLAGALAGLLSFRGARPTAQLEAIERA